MRSAVSDELVARLVSATCIRDCVKTHWIPPGFSRVEVQLEPKLVMNSFLGYQRLQPRGVSVLAYFARKRDLEG